MSEFYKASFFKRALRKIGLVTARDMDSAIAKKDEDIQSLNSFMKKMAKKAAIGKINVVSDNERFSYSDFQGDVFVIGDRNELSNCSISGSVMVSPMSKCNFFSCIQFPPLNAQES